MDPSAQNLQLQWQKEETMHGEHMMHGDVPMQERFHMHGGTSSQGGPQAWFLEYFGKLNEKDRAAPRRNTSKPIEVRAVY